MREYADTAGRGSLRRAKLAGLFEEKGGTAVGL